MDAQESDEDDEHNDQQTGKVRDGGKVNGDGAQLQGERGTVGVALPVRHSARKDRLDPADKAQHQRDQQQSGFEVPAPCGRNQDAEDKNQPSENPYQAEQ